MVAVQPVAAVSLLLLIMLLITTFFAFTSFSSSIHLPCAASGRDRVAVCLLLLIVLSIATFLRLLFPILSCLTHLQRAAFGRDQSAGIGPRFWPRFRSEFPL